MEPGVIRVALSRRNLMTMLAKLDIPQSKRMMVFPGFEGPELQILAEEDAQHYADRPPPGDVHPDTADRMDELRRERGE